jgi:hypothetical protein
MFIFKSAGGACRWLKANQSLALPKHVILQMQQVCTNYIFCLKMAVEGPGLAEAES